MLPIRTTLRCFVLALGVAACAKEKAAPKEPPAAPTSEDTIHVGPVSGKLAGEPFQVKTARYYVDSRPGYQKVDIQLLAAETDTPCGALKPEKAASVWLRKRGTTKVVTETTTTTVADAGTWDVHYQVFDAEKEWVGVGEANALVALTAPGPDLKVKGVFSACFRDAAGSCVQGEFLASFCQLSIDEPVRGTAMMERPKASLLADGGAEAERAAPMPMPQPGQELVAIEPRSHMLPAYPCSSCHATRTPHPERYELKEFHQVRNHEFSHGEDAFWCYQCHALKDLDKLTTSTGQLVSFDEAWRLCTSCHGDKLDDWRAGTHGLVLGQWNGTKLKKSCPACHDPHDPRYPSLKPEPPPAPPKGLKAL